MKPIYIVKNHHQGKIANLCLYDAGWRYVGFIDMTLEHAKAYAATHKLEYASWADVIRGQASCA